MITVTFWDDEKFTFEGNPKDYERLKKDIQEYLIKGVEYSLNY